MNHVIAILDDEPDRLREMSRILTLRYPRITAQTFDNAPDMNLWLAGNLRSCALICLDHDLGPNRRRNNQEFDPGTGRDVANYLSIYRPSCPIIIHTTNSLARPGMIMVLEEAGWTVSHVAPYDDLLWIKQVWCEAVGNALRATESYAE